MVMDMKCECGKVISSRMDGTCLACRYAQIKRKTNPKIIVNVSRLPVPLLPPTKEVRIGEVVPIYYAGESSELGRFPSSEERKARHMDDKCNRTIRCDAWTQERDEEILQMRRSGKEIADIAIATGRTKSAITNRLQKLRKMEGSSHEKDEKKRAD